MRLYCLYVILFFLFIINISVISQNVSLPFFVDNRKGIIVEYPVKNEKIRLFLDTGSGLSFIDSAIAKRLDFNNYKKTTTQTIATIDNRCFEVESPVGEVTVDSFFHNPWVLTDMKITRKILGLADNVDGLLSYDFKNNKTVLELDFIQHKLNIWDALPEFIKKDKRVIKVNLVKSDFGRENYYSKIVRTYPCIKGSLTLLDSLNLEPYFLLDTGNRSYATVLVYDSVLLKEMFAFKKIKSEQYGNNYPTTRLKIKELNIDSLYVNLNVTPKHGERSDEFNAFGNYQIGGMLGPPFFVQFEKVLIDAKSNLVYFLRKRM